MDRKITISHRDSGFTVPELVFLVLLVAVFLAGTVIMVNRGFITGSSGATGDGPALLKRINAMLANSRLIDAPIGVPVDRLKFSADIDDNISTGFDLPEGKGLELLEISRERSAGNILVARVAMGRGSVRRVVMTSRLDGRPDSFKATCLPAEGAAASGAGSVVLRLRVREGNTARESILETKLRFAPVKTL